jgi:hypothetical protein
MTIKEAKVLADEDNIKNYEACINGFWAALKRKGGNYDPTFVIPPYIKSAIDFFVAWHPFFWINLFKFNFKGIALDLRNKFTIST